LHRTRRVCGARAGAPLTPPLVRSPGRPPFPLPKHKVRHYGSSGQGPNAWRPVASPSGSLPAGQPTALSSATVQRWPALAVSTLASHQDILHRAELQKCVTAGHAITKNCRTVGAASKALDPLIHRFLVHLRSHPASFPFGPNTRLDVRAGERHL
jgi:hypothetical protein